MVRRIRTLRELQIHDTEVAEQLLSFFRGSYNHKDIAVLLVDPCPKVDEQFSEFSTIAVPKSTPPRVAIDPEETDWLDVKEEDLRPRKLQFEQTLSMYDDLVQIVAPRNSAITAALEGGPPYYLADFFAKNVEARNASTVQSLFVETWRLTGVASTGVQKLADFDFSNLEHKAWSDEWKGKLFTQLWELREELEILQYKMQVNRQTLSQLYEGDNKLLGWDKLLRTNNYAIQLMNRTTDTYVQAIGSTAAQFANEQTKNSKKLTGFAAVFVPASLCAAILAIPSFTPDAKSITKFWYEALLPHNKHPDYCG
ncbi:hypothetical protein DPSP01_008104 [Paraphaeosphaeria sporulosa]